MFPNAVASAGPARTGLPVVPAVTWQSGAACRRGMVESAEACAGVGVARGRRLEREAVQLGRARLVVPGWRQLHGLVPRMVAAGTIV
jgi:hypothetical protein